LFSTHYHELTALESSLERLCNVHARAVEENGKVVFLHQIADGPADRSYGIHVAELAGLPISLIERARDILAKLEQSSGNGSLEQGIGEEAGRENGSLMEAASQQQSELELTVGSAADRVVEQSVERQAEHRASAGNEASFEQLSMFPDLAPAPVEPHLSSKEKKALAALKEVNLLEMTPLEALNKLYELQKLLK